MEEFYVYHVVTEKEMKLNQEMLFDENNTNGVHKRVSATLDVLEGKKVSEELFNLVNANLEYWKGVALRESALEKVRRAEFDFYPSRMACLYVSQSYEDALTWAESFIAKGRKVFSVVKLLVKGRLFKGNAFNCFEGCDDSERNESLARAYWQNKENENVLYEYLVDGHIKVVEILKTF